MGTVFGFGFDALGELSPKESWLFPFAPPTFPGDLRTHDGSQACILVVGVTLATSCSWNLPEITVKF